MKKRDLEKHLRLHGCIQLKGGANHDKWKNPNNGNKSVVPRHNEINTFTGKAICDQLGIPMIEKK